MQTAELLRMDQRVGEIVDAMAHQSSVDGFEKRLNGVVDIIDACNPEVAHTLTAGYAGSRILERCVDQPDQMVLGEFGMMAAMYADRSLITQSAGNTTTEFITRTPDETAVDTLYRRIESPQGTTAIIEPKAWLNEYDNCQVIAREGDCQVVVSRYYHGMNRDVALSLGTGGRGDVVISTLYAKTLWARASELMLERSVEKQRESDRAALSMLVQLQIARRII